MDGRFLEILFDCDPTAMTVINDCNSNGDSPLSVAEKAGNVEAVRVLRSRGAKKVCVVCVSCCWRLPLLSALCIEDMHLSQFAALAAFLAYFPSRGWFHALWIY
jgi:hypothetical protein